MCVHETWGIVFDHVTKRWPGAYCSLNVLNEGDSCFEISIMLKSDHKEKLIYSRLGGDPKHLYHGDIDKHLLSRIQAFLDENQPLTEASAAQSKNGEKELPVDEDFEKNFDGEGDEEA